MANTDAIAANAVAEGKDLLPLLHHPDPPSDPTDSEKLSAEATAFESPVKTCNRRRKEVSHVVAHGRWKSGEDRDRHSPGNVSASTTPSTTRFRRHLMANFTPTSQLSPQSWYTDLDGPATPRKELPLVNVIHRNDRKRMLSTTTSSVAVAGSTVVAVLPKLGKTFWRWMMARKQQMLNLKLNNNTQTQAHPMIAIDDDMSVIGAIATSVRARTRAASSSLVDESGIARKQ